MHGRYCWQRWRGSVVLQHLGLEPLLTAFLTLPAVGGNTLSTSGLGRFLVFLYIWLPFMILPVQAALERLPPSLLQASADPAHVHDKPFAMWCCRWQSGYCRWLYLYLLTHTGRFYRPAAGWSSVIFYRQYGLFPAGGDWQYADGGGIHHSADCSHRTVRRS